MATLFDDLKQDAEIILLDYQATLVGNFKERNAWFKQNGRRAYTEWIKQERLRGWLVDLIKDRYVILITARSVKYREITLDLIKQKTGWFPNEFYFNEWDDTPPVCKQKHLHNSIFKKHGYHDKKYIGLESNAQTRAMYKRNGIYSFRIDDPIPAIPKL